MRKNRHSLPTYLLLTNKRDLKGRTLSEEERRATQPWHPYWEDKAQELARTLGRRVGAKAFELARDQLPEEVDEWSPQQWAYAFERALGFVERVPLGASVTAKELAIAITARPISLHPYGAARLRGVCPRCQGSANKERSALPYLLDSRGYVYRCSQGHEWYFQDEGARELWDHHLEKVMQIIHLDR